MEDERHRYDGAQVGDPIVGPQFRLASASGTEVECDRPQPDGRRHRPGHNRGLPRSRPKPPAKTAVYERGSVHVQVESSVEA